MPAAFFLKIITMADGFIYADALSGIGAGSGSGIQYSKDKDGNIYGTIPAVTVSSKKSGGKFDWNSLVGNVTTALPGVLSGIAAIKGNYNQPVQYEPQYTGTTNNNLLIIAAIAFFLILLFMVFKRMK